MNRIRICFLALCLFLAACSNVEIYSGLTEDQANIMLSTLLKRGIEAEKISAGKAGYTISVNPDQMVQALEILSENSLPKENYQNLGTVFSGQGMIASASEEKSRLAYAISQELSDTFSRIDGVLSARVHIVLAEVDTINNKVTEASASVFLRHTPDSSVVNFVPKIKELTAGAVADLKPEKVSVMLVPARDSVTVPETTEKPTSLLSDQGLNINTLIFVLIAALLINGLIFGLQLLYKKKLKKQAPDDQSN